MHEMKDTARAVVRIGFDGRVHKTFRGHLAQERFEHEVRVLRYLEQRGCTFVPRLLEVDPTTLKIVTTNCGGRVDQLNPERQIALFAELEHYGIRHEDRELRNITYRISDGRFCIIDFEFATILDDGTGKPVSLKPSLTA
jgi:tRNA A-37 threonylcarbamoyl transferase component Bud32